MSLGKNDAEAIAAAAGERAFNAEREAAQARASAAAALATLTKVSARNEEWFGVSKVSADRVSAALLL